LRRLPVDAAIPFALWLFVWFFPGPPLGPRDRSWSRFFLGISLVAAVTLIAANTFLWLTESRSAGIAAAFDRYSRGSYFSLLQFLPTVPALPYLLWKSRFEALEERRRATLFAVLLIVGLAPMILAVVVSPFIRYFDDASNRQFVGFFLYAALASVVPLTAYAVLVQRVMDVELLITNAMRYAFVRRVAWLVGVVPLLALAAYVYKHRELTVIQIVGAPTTLLFLPGAFLALVVITFRRQLLQAIDRRFLVAPPTYPDVIRRLERGFREARGVRDVAAVLTREADRAVHPTIVAFLVPDNNGRQLTSLTAPIAPLAVDSTLGQLLRLARDEIYAGVEATGPVGRLLPEDERRWLRDTGVQLLVPMLASASDLLGVIVVGEKRGGQRLSMDDRLLLAMMAGQAAVVLENHALRERSFQHLSRPSGRPGVIDWDDEPGAMCGACLTMWPAMTTICTCGHPTAPAALPVSIRGNFRVERLLGAGGMGVVYLATDIALDRRVAIKTLPHVTVDRALRLQREARAMAAVRHPNLAMIFGVESWREAPLLIAEYLEGGTLADRLRRAALSWEDAIELGIVLADVLDQVHASGVLHRDIKPTNVGFTREGVPKLLDFGVAMMRDPIPSDADGVLPSSLDRDRALNASAFPVAGASLTHADHLVGTPLYLSPEALDGAEPDQSWDLWALSLLLFEAVAGQHPFAAPTIPQVFERIRHAQIDIRDFCADCPPALVAFFRSALARDRARRPASAAELRKWLQQLRTDLQLD
jgi:hypothetical protein